METLIAPEVETKLDEEIKKLFNRDLVLYNDDVNTFEHVIECLVKYCDHVPPQAEQCALIVHHNGKCQIKNGTYEELEPIAKALLEEKLSVKIV